jgi:hypothetical protein
LCHPFLLKFAPFRYNTRATTATMDNPTAYGHTMMDRAPQAVVMGIKLVGETALI